MQTYPERADTASESYPATVRRLAAAQKSGKGAPAYSRFVNRRLGRYLAAGAYRVGLTPNTVTAVSGAASFTGIALLALLPASWPLGVLVSLALVVGYALDSADGQLARLQGGGSVSGEWLDHMLDCAKISSLHLAVMVQVYRFFPVDERWALVPAGFTVVAAVAFFGMILNDQLRRSSARGRAVPSPAASTVRSLLVLPTDYGVLCLAFVLLGAPVLFLGVYTFLFLGSAGYLVLALVKWFGDMRALDVRSSP